MSDDRLERLMDRALDGVATPDEVAKLDATLAGNPRARARFEELRGMFRTLSETIQDSPPSDLHDGIMDRVRDAGRPRTEVRRVLPRPAVARVAFAFVCGSLATVVVWLALSPHSPNASLPFEGAMLPPAAPLGAAFVLETQDARAVARVSENDRGVRVDLDCSGAATELKLQGSARTLAATAVRFESGPAGRITPQANGVEILPAGPAHYQVWFDRIGAGAADLTLQLRSDDGIRSTSLLTTDRSGENR